MPLTSQQIRRQFIDFFVEKHGHTFVPSSPVVPHNDETLLFANAGMNQFKPYFLGVEKAPWPRVANTQKCIRAGGKHNDLDDVGRSRRHHTFFEMLGNWSFGDYFKAEAIQWAWELLTKIWKIDPTLLHVTCYEGDPAAGIPRDDEAAQLWKQIAGIPDDHIHYFGKENFWEMGDTGPCGPCSEIHIDRTPDHSGGSLVNSPDPRVMEIWNLVFIQYNRDAAGKLTPLPARHVDTGMGYERITHVLQGAQDNYGTDLWRPLFDAIEGMTGLRYTGQFPPTNAADPVAEAANEQLRHDIAFRVVADHARCLTFALTDGVVPSNEGRGYVMRRILRRAARFGRQTLGLHETFLHKLVPLVVDTMGEAFPELKKNPQRVMNLIEEEEISFGRTLDRGLREFEFAISLSRAVDKTVKFPGAQQTAAIDAAAAFKLHDTYGFPIDLTRIMAEERGLSVDIAGYEKLMEQAKELARSGGREAESLAAQLPPDALADLQRRGIRPTDDEPKFSHQEIPAKVLAVWYGDSGHFGPEAIATDKDIALILDKTSFYAEMGGQVGDAGELRSPAGAIFDVSTTRIVGGYVLHVGKMRGGALHVGETVTAIVLGGRERTEKNHTATHMLNWALRRVLGGDVLQKGSLVDPEKLRFDFSHGQAVADEEIAQTQALVNQAIGQKIPVYTGVAPQEKALKINGLRAVFGEKYPAQVRVLSVGVSLPELLADPASAKWRDYSIEFCGGTHLTNTSQIEAFTIVAEESVSKGVRRIVALTGDAARESQRQGDAVDELAAQAASAADANCPALLASLQKAIAAGSVPLNAKRRGQAAVAQLQGKLKALEKAQKAQASGGNTDVLAAAAALLPDAMPLGPGRLIVGEIPWSGTEPFLAAVDSLKKKAGSYAILLAANDGQKLSLAAAVSDDLIALGLKAGDWVRQAAQIAGGGGGGRPQMAQGSGKDPSRLADVLSAARDFAAKAVH